MKISSYGIKAILFCLVMMLFNTYLSAQAPEAFNYQAVARDGLGEVIQNQQITLRISILQGDSESTLAYQEEQAVLTSDRGIFSIRIGEGSTMTGIFSDIDWSIGAYYVRVEIDPLGGQNFIDLGSTKLYSVPYALYANRAGNSDSGGGTSPDTTSSQPSLWQEDDGDLVYDGGGEVIYRVNDNDQWAMGSDADGGFWTVLDETGFLSSYAFTWESGAGFISTTGPNGNGNVRLSTISGLPNNGFLGIADENGSSRIAAYVRDTGSGDLFVEGPSGNLNAYITNLFGEPDHGYLAVYDAQEEARAGIFVDDQGQGRVFADFVDNIVDNPDKADEKIIYTMVQGPEAAAYLRGTGTMVNGTASIDFPSHFSTQILAENMTVQITPLSADSKGIAVIKKGISGFRVQELLSGQGNYSFDWEVKGVRKASLYKSRVGTQGADRMKVDSAQSEERKVRAMKSSDTTQHN